VTGAQQRLDRTRFVTLVLPLLALAPSDEFDLTL